MMYFISGTNIYIKICSRILLEQEAIVGSLAWEVAAKVRGLLVTDRKTGEIAITDEPKKVIDTLVTRFGKIFGSLSDDVCKKAVSDIIVEMPVEDIPDTLKTTNQIFY